MNFAPTVRSHCPASISFSAREFYVSLIIPSILAHQSWYPVVRVDRLDGVFWEDRASAI